MKLELDFEVGEPEVIVHRAEVRWGDASVYVALDHGTNGRYFVDDEVDLSYDDAIARATAIVRAEHITQMALRAATAAVERELMPVKQKKATS